MTEHRTYVVGAPLGLGPARTHLDLGPEHPTRSGAVEIVTEIEGDVITRAEVRPGRIHRAAEKLFEVRDYRQVLALADRHDWQGSFAGELGVALTVEAALGLQAPERAVWLRTLLAEHTRLHSHLGFLTYAARRGTETGDAVSSLREALREQLADLSGNRVHPMLTRLGGLAADAAPEWLEAEVRLVRAVAALTPALRQCVSALPPGVAVMPTEVVSDFGVTGPAARAAGVDVDLRRSAPYLAYADLDLTSASGQEGDAVARLRCWVDELAPTAALVEQLAAGLTTRPGPVDVMLPKVVRVPEGETYVATESPLGRSGWWLVSRGEKQPWRLKMRTASFAHVSALEAVLPGTPVEHLGLAVASVGYVVGDLAK